VLVDVVHTRKGRRARSRQCRHRRRCGGIFWVRGGGGEADAACPVALERADGARRRWKQAVHGHRAGIGGASEAMKRRAAFLGAWVVRLSSSSMPVVPRAKRWSTADAGEGEVGWAAHGGRRGCLCHWQSLALAMPAVVECTENARRGCSSFLWNGGCASTESEMTLLPSAAPRAAQVNPSHCCEIPSAGFR
jgi:hypothetical protein